MKIDLRKTLLAGTAIAAVGAFAASPAFAQAQLTGNSTWGTTAPVNAPTAGDDVDLEGFDLLINNTNNTAVGDITDTGATPDGAVTITTSAAADIAQTIGSIDNGTGNFSALNTANDGNVVVTITNGFAIGGNVVVNAGADATTADVVTVTVGGNADVDGTTAITAGANAGGNATAALNLDGATNEFTGAVTVTGGAGAATNTATISLSGAANTFTGGLTLTNGAAGAAILAVDGAVAQTVTGVIAGDGTINVTNTHASGVTFAGDSTHTGALTVNNDGNDQTVTFTGDNASAIALGDNTGADTITANFSGTTQAISGGITGGAAETVDVNFSGGSTITLSGAASSSIDTADITGSTTVTTNQNLAATNITVASGSTLATTANAITGAIANNGTLQLGGGNIVGAITGTGLLDVNAAANINGAITQGTADIAAFTLTQAAASGYTVGTTNFSGAGTLALLGGNQTVTGNFTNTTDGQGTITVSDVAGTTAFVGDLGASTSHSLAALTILDGGTQANVATTTGDLFVDAITVGATDTLSLIGTSAQTVSGTITGGTLNVGTGTTSTDVTFNGVLAGLAGVTVNDGATARFAANATSTGALSADAATIQVANGATFTAATQTDADVTQWNIGVSNDAGTQTNGTVAFTGDNVNLAVDTVNFVVGASSQPLTTGASVLDNVFTGNAQNVIAGATVTDNSFLYGFTLVDDTNNVDVTITQTNSFAASSDSSATAAGATNLLTDPAMVASTDATVNALQADVQGASTREAYNDAAEQATPTIDGSNVAAAINVGNSAANVTFGRMAALRSGDTVTGMTTGNVSQGMKVWGQGFGSHGEQDVRDGIDGYDYDTYGVSVGLDTENMSDSTVFGIGFTYANTEADSDNGSRTQTELDTYQFSVYANHNFAENIYLDGVVSYGFNDIETSRTVANATALGEYDADLFSARAEVGRDYAYEGATLSPFAMAHWSHFDPESYTETGAGNAGQVIDPDAVSVFELGVGVNATWMYQNADGSHFKPRLSAGFRYDLVGDQVEMTSRFIQPGAVAFSTEGADPAQAAVDLGAGFTYYSTTNWELSAGYDYEWKEDFDAHTGVLRAAYRF